MTIIMLKQRLNSVFPINRHEAIPSSMKQEG